MKNSLLGLALVAVVAAGNANAAFDDDHRGIDSGQTFGVVTTVAFDDDHRADQKDGLEIGDTGAQFAASDKTEGDGLKFGAAGDQFAASGKTESDGLQFGDTA